jgi:hypothetical protein
MLRLIGFLAVLCVGGGGFLAIDYNLARKKALAEDAGPLSIPAYIDDLYGRLSAVASASDATDVPSALVDMLPKAPEGWTARPAVASDHEAFVPQDRGEGDPNAVRLIRDMLRLKFEDAEDVAAITYERGERRVVFLAVKYPDGLFTNPEAYDHRYRLQTEGARYRGLDSMTVRGLDITEDMLPDGMPGRMFLANLGGQVQLRVLASRRLKDDDLVPFFQTLNVKALNALRAQPEDGLGEVPVILVASALSQDGLDRYVAARTSREADVVAAAAAARDLAEVEVAQAKAAAGEVDDAERPSPAEPVIDCKKGDGGIKRCTVAP